MLRGIIICPDADLHDRLQAVLADVGFTNVTRSLDHSPNSLELLRIVRAHAPQVLFLSIDSMQKATEVVQELEKQAPGTQVIAISRVCDPQILLNLMRTGVREFASLPFDRNQIGDSLVRLSEQLNANPPEIETTDDVFSFL